MIKKSCVFNCLADVVLGNRRPFGYRLHIILFVFAILSLSFGPLKGQGRVFGTNSEILEADNQSELDLTNEITLEAIIKITDGQKEKTRIIDKCQNPGGGGFALGFGKDNKLWMMAGGNEITSDITVPIGKWVDVVGTFSKQKGVMKLYMDGKQVGEFQKLNLSPINHTNFPLRVGADAEENNRFSGFMSRVIIFGNCLEAGQIVQTKAKATSNAIVDWRLDKYNPAGYVSKTTNHLILTPKRVVLPASPTISNNKILWYNRPANPWIEALPIGNGRLGAMVFGRPERERLQLNEITVWSGGPQPDADRKDAYKYLDTIRNAISKGDYKECAKLTAQYFTSSAPYTASYQTLGDLSLQFKLPTGKIENYWRWLDIDKAITGVNFKINNDNYLRESFSSAADGVLVQHLTTTAKAGLSFGVDLTRLEKTQTRFEAPNTLVMTGTTGKTLSFEVRLTVLQKGGKLTASGNRLLVENASEATVLITCGTSYVLSYADGYVGADAHELAVNRMATASQKSFFELKANHIKEYQQFFRRVDIDLGSNEKKMQLPTDDRLRAYQDGNDDAGFAALFYQYGRYLLISSSRPDNLLPSNAQGIWGDGLELPWKCDYKSNINYEMNYWQAEPANLAELEFPMIRMTQSLNEPGTKTAKTYFGPNTPGWYYGYTTNAWGWTSPGSGLSWGVFAGGSGWACQQLWEHYAFSRDTAYLQSVYPTLKGAAEFYMATMINDKDGYLVTSPSTSPENIFVTDDGIKSNVGEGATMERAIVWDLLDNVAKACKDLGTDKEFMKRVINDRDRIKPLQIGKAGQLMEWSGDWDMNSDDMHHRHVSHLFPLHPGHQISALGTPNSAAAAKKSLELRGDDGTGWSLAWKENFWARLRNGNRVHKLLANQLRFTLETKTIMADAGGTYPNLFDAHPPFQIDGNFGAVSGITELLLQSSEMYKSVSSNDNDTYVLDILPALPDAWPKGSVSGLKARGDYRLSFAWEKGKFTKGQLTALHDGTCKLRLNVPFTINGKLVNTPSSNGYYELEIVGKAGENFTLSAN